MITVQCPACQRPYRLDSARAGETVQCDCGQLITVPGLESAWDMSQLMTAEDLKGSSGKTISLADMLRRDQKQSRLVLVVLALLLLGAAVLCGACVIP